MMTFLRCLLSGLFLTLGLGVGYGYWLCRRALPVVKGSLSLPGLQQPVEVIRDGIGVPHIAASSLDDVVYAQGYVTAQDRLWQMDVARRAGYGELAEIFGPRALEADREQRILGFKRVAMKQAQNLPAEDLRLLQRYADGVNAFLESHQNRLPIEFQVLRYQPSPWKPADTLVLNLWMGKLLNTSWKVDLMREMLRRKLEARQAAFLLPETSPDDLILIGSDEVPDSGAVKIGSRLRLPAAHPLQAHSNSPEAFGPARAKLTDSELRTALAQGLAPLATAGAGSNNWVVSGNRTVSGKPLLANDPHLPHGVPSIWYMTHLRVPGVLNVSGVAIPGSPLVILGHNEHIAWGVTNLAPDVQDLYVETLDPQRPDSYRTNDRWEEMEVREERIAVRGGEPQVLKVRSTRHGPVIQELPGRVLSLRWTLLRERASIPIQPALNAARDWNEFVRALERYSGPVQNWVFADRAGNIGFLNAGSIPIRARGDGSVPVPGETDAYEWIGEIPFEKLPRLFNPPSGMIVTANNRIVGRSYPHLLTRNWMSPHRARRIHQLLKAKQKLDAKDMLQIQGDVYSSTHHLISRSILNAIRSARSNSSAALGQTWNEIETLLEAYDFQARADSAAATVCERFREVFLEEILKSKLGEDWKLYQWSNRSTVVENLLRERPPEFRPDPFSSYDSFILDCLQKVREQLATRFSTDEPQRWLWGEYSPIEFKHPLAAFWPLTRLLNTGPYPQPGAPLTVKQTTPSHGVSMRLVVDFSDPDGSLNNITLGQSGQLFSRHYRDQFEHWLNVRSFPMWFTPAEIRRQAAALLRLEPSPIE